MTSRQAEGLCLSVDGSPVLMVVREGSVFLFTCQDNNMCPSRAEPGWTVHPSTGYAMQSWAVCGFFFCDHLHIVFPRWPWVQKSYLGMVTSHSIATTFLEGLL